MPVDFDEAMVAFLREHDLKMASEPPVDARLVVGADGLTEEMRANGRRFAEQTKLDYEKLERLRETVKAETKRKLKLQNEKPRKSSFGGFR